MHAMGANAGGQVGSVMAAAVMLSVLKEGGYIERIMNMMFQDREITGESPISFFNEEIR